MGIHGGKASQLNLLGWPSSVSVILGAAGYADVGPALWNTVDWGGWSGDPVFQKRVCAFLIL